MFPEHSFGELGSYVYRLVDPRNSQTFYVGVGVGNRLFDHVAEAEKGIGPKHKQINEILADGVKVTHIVHRFGMDSDTAREVESALIDAYPGLTNLKSGDGAARSGTLAEILAESYQVSPAVISKKALFVSVNRSVDRGRGIKTAARAAWGVNINRARNADIVVAVRHRVIRGVFKPQNWRLVTAENFPEFGDDELAGVSGKYGFDIEQELSDYLGEGLPEEVTLSQSGFAYNF